MSQLMCLMTGVCFMLSAIFGHQSPAHTGYDAGVAVGLMLAALVTGLERAHCKSLTASDK
jgi:hypothetical protein